MSDLVEFLKARISEDEQAAHKAAERCGCHPEAPSWTFGDESTDGRIVIVDDPHPEMRHKLNRRWNGTYEGLFAAEHITRHDPARVLRDVESKRRLLEIHGAEPHECVAWDDVLGEICRCYESDCPTLRLLAESYAEHQDYRQEWAP